MNLAVVVVVLALAAATFVLSYPGVHTIVAQAGVSARLARIYPGLFDALFVVACAAAVVLRDTRWWAQLYAWLIVILTVAVGGAADAVHAMDVTLRHRTMEGVVAAAPWVIVLLGFSLMLIMLRRPRSRRATGKAPAPETAWAPEGLSIFDAAPAAPQADSPQPESPVAVAEEPVASPAPEAGLPAEEALAAISYGDSGKQAMTPVTVPGSVVDDDAPPFAYPAPRLTRVRSTPTPPEGDNGEEFP